MYPCCVYIDYSRGMKHLAYSLIFIFNITDLSAQQLPLLKIADNNRYLITEDGKPFFWLGDTAWELIHRLDREEVAQ